MAKTKTPKVQRKLQRDGNVIRFINVETKLSPETMHMVAEKGFEGLSKLQLVSNSNDFNLVFETAKACEKAMGDLVCEPNTPVNQALLDALSLRCDYEIDDPEGMAGFAESVVESDAKPKAKRKKS